MPYAGERSSQAKRDFPRLMQGVELRGRSFLDLGFGQGLNLLIAASLGAQAVGCDINPTCEEVLAQIGAFSPNWEILHPHFIGSILEEEVIATLRRASPNPEAPTI